MKLEFSSQNLSLLNWSKPGKYHLLVRPRCGCHGRAGNSSGRKRREEDGRRPELDQPSGISSADQYSGHHRKLGDRVPRLEIMGKSTVGRAISNLPPATHTEKSNSGHFFAYPPPSMIPMICSARETTCVAASQFTSVDQGRLKRRIGRKKSAGHRRLMLHPCIAYWTP
ncbi:unnamed protein product [Linum trigynum]|uniref:Uncharacterized protein n=1 Tax=Linum trigynum TaxID=586398 RepID=A0AAV2GCH4_9ROSI